MDTAGTATFKRMVRSFAASLSRRSMVRALVLSAGSIPLVDARNAASSDRRKRRRRRKRCKPSRLCANRCGQVIGKGCTPVDCGPCTCAACAACQACNPETGVCMPDAAAIGAACGQPGQRCQADGRCACDGASCGVCQACGADGVCTLQANGTACGTRNGADDFLRCCNGICPAPGCVPSGSVPSVTCPGGTPDCAGIACCSQKAAICSAPCFCLFSDAGEICASDEDCNDPLVHPERRFCICGVCVIP